MRHGRATRGRGKNVLDQTAKLKKKLNRDSAEISNPAAKWLRRATGQEKTSTRETKLKGLKTLKPWLAQCAGDFSKHPLKKKRSLNRQKKVVMIRKNRLLVAPRLEENQ